MTKETVLQRLKATDVPAENDYAVPINGETRKLPYYVIRTKETLEGSDNGKVQILKIEWVVALFTKNRDDALEIAFLMALSHVGKVEVIRYPDGTPYQTTFKFTTKQLFR